MAQRFTLDRESYHFIKKNNCGVWGRAEGSMSGAGLGVANQRLLSTPDGSQWKAATVWKPPAAATCVRGEPCKARPPGDARRFQCPTRVSATGTNYKQTTIMYLTAPSWYMHQTYQITGCTFRGGFHLNVHMSANLATIVKKYLPINSQHWVVVINEKKTTQ